MLARELYRRARPGRPVRYQTDRGLRRPLGNFLALATRGSDLPHLASLAQGQGHLHHPAVPDLLHGMFQEHDPQALGVLHDLLHEHGGHVPGTMPAAHPHGMPASGGALAAAQFGNRLGDLAHFLFPHGGMPAGLVEHLRNRFDYDPAAAHPALGNFGSGAGRTPLVQHWYDVMPWDERALLASQYGTGALGAHQTLHLMDALDAVRAQAAVFAQPQGYVNLYDMLHGLQQRPDLDEATRGRLGHNRAQLAAAIHTLILPLLHGGQIDPPQG